MATAADSQHAVFNCHDSRKWPIFNSDDRNLVNGMTVKGTTKFTTTCACSMISAAVSGPYVKTT
eukprot:CAMPEP_0177795466 /NCGR_PEP_ID=MMETSP0491_2-20121128/26247_1 /TAXON_ID=63592 /ORGANISM="Tetraselmis chuii, Strain PLY429" /LENGTH=63 /DNA_ID=CAMNT_0019318297 /DNA_START=50 /DNA_END=241 /DNA_ORIENTATION=+